MLKGLLLLSTIVPTNKTFVCFQWRSNLGTSRKHDLDIWLQTIRKRGKVLSVWWDTKSKLN